MHISNSILAGEILTILENASCSIRIIDFVTILRITKKEAYIAVATLLSEDMNVLIKEDGRTAIALSKGVEITEFETIARDKSEQSVEIGQEVGTMAYNQTN